MCVCFVQHTRWCWAPAASTSGNCWAASPCGSIQSSSSGTSLYTTSRLYSVSLFLSYRSFLSCHIFAERSAPYAETLRYEISLMLTRGIDIVTIKIYFGVKHLNTIHDFHAHAIMKTWRKKTQTKKSHVLSCNWKWLQLTKIMLGQLSPGWKLWNILPHPELIKLYLSMRMYLGYGTRRKLSVTLFCSMP